MCRVRGANLVIWEGSIRLREMFSRSNFAGTSST